MSDTFIPKWTGGGEGTAPPKGFHIFALRVLSGEWKDTQSEKPYANLQFVVESTKFRKSEYAGFKFYVRQYVTEKSESMVRYFLMKFDYPEELLKDQRPELSMKKIIGLSGEAIVEIAEDNMGMLRFNLRGYGHHGEEGIEDKVAKIMAADAKKAEGEAARQPEPERDVNDDVRQAEAESPFGDLDEEATGGGSLGLER